MQHRAAYCVYRLRQPNTWHTVLNFTEHPHAYTHTQIGTVVDDPLDGNANRLSKGQRRSTLTEQLLVDAELTTSRKRRFNKLQVCCVCICEVVGAYF